MDLIFRYVAKNELTQIKSIDRGEEILEKYEWQGDQLVLVPDYQLVEAFSQDELDEITSRQIKLIDEGGKVIGAFNGDKLIGIVSVEKKWRAHQADFCKMDILYVSKSYRRMKVGRRLVEESKKEAKHFGAKKLYISATPTKNTVDFYFKVGGRVLEEIDLELWNLEPEDIHLEISV